MEEKKLITNNIELRDAIRKLNPLVQICNLSPEICGMGTYNTIYISVPLYCLNIPKEFTRDVNEIRNKKTGVSLEVLPITEDIESLLMLDLDVIIRKKIY